jgi:hypothetical protein
MLQCYATERPIDFSNSHNWTNKGIPAGVPAGVSLQERLDVQQRQRKLMDYVVNREILRRDAAMRQALIDMRTCPLPPPSEEVEEEQELPESHDWELWVDECAKRKWPDPTMREAAVKRHIAPINNAIIQWARDDPSWSPGPLLDSPKCNIYRRYDQSAHQLGSCLDEVRHLTSRLNHCGVDETKLAHRTKEDAVGRRLICDTYLRKLRRLGPLSSLPIREQRKLAQEILPRLVAALRNSTYFRPALKARANDLIGCTLLDDDRRREEENSEISNNNRSLGLPSVLTGIIQQYHEIEPLLDVDRLERGRLDFEAEHKLLLERGYGGDDDDHPVATPLALKRTVPLIHEEPIAKRARR